MAMVVAEQQDVGRYWHQLFFSNVVFVFLLLNCAVQYHNFFFSGTRDCEVKICFD